METSSKINGERQTEYFLKTLLLNPRINFDRKKGFISTFRIAIATESFQFYKNLNLQFNCYDICIRNTSSKDGVRERALDSLECYTSSRILKTLTGRFSHKIIRI